MRELDTKPAAKAYEASDSNEAKNEDMQFALLSGMCVN